MGLCVRFILFAKGRICPWMLCFESCLLRMRALIDLWRFWITLNKFNQAFQKLFIPLCNLLLFQKALYFPNKVLRIPILILLKGLTKIMFSFYLFAGIFINIFIQNNMYSFEIFLKAIIHALKLFAISQLLIYWIHFFVVCLFLAFKMSYLFFIVICLFEDELVFHFFVRDFFL